MPHIITIIAIVYVVAVALFMVYVPDEDYTVLAGILAFLVPLVIIAVAVDEAWKQ
ncbi:hypothetical protein CTI12_AA168490 [Artemisia annua]|uniref:Uncharacterized protein n=1 Tax=Artemisia annua TaxID=35608 RepID=A0A2U1PC41_ARTAN|nr:hypothetical protein CTI12_AA168490 [Artemisia annua]